MLKAVILKSLSGNSLEAPVSQIEFEEAGGRRQEAGGR